MKRVLFISEKSYPNMTPITNCLRPIIDNMINCNVKVDVLTYRKEKNYKKTEIIDNINIYRVTDYYNVHHDKKILSLFSRIWRKLFLPFNFILKGKKLLISNKYDAVIACSYPFLMERMAYYITKYTKVPFFSYQLDPYYNNTLLGNKNKKKRLKEEIRILSKAKKIFLPYDNYNENILGELSVLKEKYYPIDFALIKKWPVFQVIKNEKLVFAFAGAFYEKIRTPFLVFDFFKEIKDLNYLFILYCITNDSLKEKIGSNIRTFEEKFEIHYNADKKICDQVLYNSNFLVNIGNMISNQTPSKVYELISSGKPIINFYFIDNDTSVNLLKKYDNCINIKLPHNDDDIVKFLEFTKKNKNINYSFEEITKKYKSADEIALEFKNVIEVSIQKDKK